MNGIKALNKAGEIIIGGLEKSIETLDEAQKAINLELKKFNSNLDKSVINMRKITGEIGNEFSNRANALQGKSSANDILNDQRTKTALFNEIYNNLQSNTAESVKNFLENKENYSDFNENELNYMKQNNLDFSKFVPYNVYAITWYDFFNKFTTNIKQLFGNLEIQSMGIHPAATRIGRTNK